MNKDLPSIRRENLRQWFAERPIPHKEKSYLSQLMRGKASFGERAARRLELDYSMGIGYLDNDIRLPNLLTVGSTNTDRIKVDRLLAMRHISVLEAPVRRVPLISWAAAGHWASIEDPFTPDDADYWLPCPVKHSSKTFALKIRSLSMHNPYGVPSFNDGDVVFVDPEREASNKSLVVIRMEDAKEATFKRLLIDNGAMFLEALNPSWPSRIFKVEERATICGVVVARLETFI
ncbi:MAG: LexA family protein [Shewanella sp.]